MFALLRQLSKLLLLVFNLPQVLSLLGNLFKFSVGENGKLELGIVDTIAKSVVAEDTARLKQEVEEGKQKDIQEVDEETEQLKSIYADLSPESRAFFTQQAESRRLRRIQQINNRSADDIINEEVVGQLVDDKKKQLEPSIVPALAPVTALLGIPIFLTKLGEYVSAASGLDAGVTSKETADGFADGYTSGLEGGDGEVFNAVVSTDGTLEVSFFGIQNVEDFKIFTNPEKGDRITLTVTDSNARFPIAAAHITNYGALDGSSPTIRDFFSISIVGENVIIDVTKAPDISTLFKSLFRQEFGFDTETEITVSIVDSIGSAGIVKIPIEVSLDNRSN